MFAFNTHTTPNPVAVFSQAKQYFSFPFLNLLSCVIFTTVVVVYCVLLSFYFHFHRNTNKYTGRFVGPFSDLIRSWEKTISLIFEVIDQWVNFTQRKWLYLEGIFVNNDARIKLPAIAAKFDLIDDEYIKVFIDYGSRNNPI